MTLLRSTLALSLMASLAALGGGCSPASSSEEAEVVESDLSRHDVVYRFASKATIPEHDAIVVGASKEGAVILAQTRDASGLPTNRTHTYVWNGATLEDRGDGPFYATGSMAYDATTGTTWFLQLSANSNATSRYESLFRWQNGEWSQRYSRAAEGMTQQLFVDAASGKLMRITENGVAQYREEGTQTQPVRGFFGVEGGSFDRPAAAYDSARKALVVFSGSGVQERRAGASPWSPAVWSTVGATRTTPAGTYLGYCDEALFDAGRSSVVQFCSSYGRDGFAWEWDGTAFRFARTAADPTQGRVPRFKAYDVVHAQLVGVDITQTNASIQIATRVQENVTNTKPVLADGSKSFEIYATEESKLAIAGIDADHDTLTTKILDLPAGASFDGKTLSWKPELADVGMRLLNVQLSDGEDTVVQPASVTVKSVTYPALGADVAVQKDFWFHGSASLRGAKRGSQGHAVCTISGKNPGVVRARCSVSMDVCTGGGYPSANACSTYASYGIAIEGALAPNGSLYQRKSESPSCSGFAYCPRWSGAASVSLDGAGNVCVGFEYERDSTAHGYSGTARTTGSSCP